MLDKGKMKNAWCKNRWRGLLAGLGLLAAGPALAFECGGYAFPKCDGPDLQYAGGFAPQTGFGDFGGGACKAKRTPVVFIPGNGDRAIDWDSPAQRAAGEGRLPPRSVYDEFRNRGYNDCELFGVTYLDRAEQDNPQGNYHRPEKYRVIAHFLRAVKTYTGAERVDVVTHSLGASMTLAALKVHDAWGDVRRFVNIAGGIRGLDSCLYVGPANPMAPTCGSENLFDHEVFGFYPQVNTGPAPAPSAACTRCRAATPACAST